MDRAISRRDLMNGMAMAIGASALAPELAAQEAAQPDSSYSPERTGKRIVSTREQYEHSLNILILQKSELKRLQQRFCRVAATYCSA